MVHYNDQMIGGANSTRIITLDAPEKANALSLGAMGELSEAIGTAGDRVIVLTGAGKSFCGGLDLDEIAALGSVKKHLEAFVAVFDVWSAHQAPIVSLVNGPAAAGGIGLAVCADVCVARASATLTVPRAAPYAPLVRFLTAIVTSFRPGASMDRFLGVPVPVSDADDLVDHVIANDAAFDVDPILERLDPTIRKRKTIWNDGARALVHDLIEDASNGEAAVMLFEALDRRHR